MFYLFIWTSKLNTYRCSLNRGGSLLVCIRWLDHAQGWFTNTLAVTSSIKNVGYYSYISEEVRQGQKVINEMITCLYKLNGEAFSPLYP